MAKLLDYTEDIPALERDPNPFAAVVLAHWQTIQTRRQPAKRYYWKVRLIKSLFDRGLTAEPIRQLYRLIDWMMELPVELDRQFSEEIRRHEEGRKMPYISSVERLAQEEGEKRGLRGGIELALELKFGPEGLSLVPRVRETQDLEALRAVRDALRTAENISQIQQLLRQFSGPISWSRA